MRGTQACVISVQQTGILSQDALSITAGDHCLRVNISGVHVAVPCWHWPVGLPSPELEQGLFMYLLCSLSVAADARLCSHVSEVAGCCVSTCTAVVVVVKIIPWQSVSFKFFPSEMCAMDLLYTNYDSLKHQRQEKFICRPYQGCGLGLGLTAQVLHPPQPTAR